MEKNGWRYALCCLLLVLFLAAVILYIRDLKSGLSTKGATLIWQAEERWMPG